MDNILTLDNSIDTLTYRGYLFMLRISEQGSFCTEISKEVILAEILEIQQMLGLNELEINLWGIYLEKFGWHSFATLTQKLLFTAYTSKAILNEGIASLKSKILEKYPFFTNYESWMVNYRSSVNVGYIEINSNYMKLSKVDSTEEEIDSYDYNSAVTQLIENSTRTEKQDS